MLCQFRQYGSSSFCDSWEWKLDPYSVYDRHQPVDLYIENADVAIDEETVLYEQQDGFFLRRISRTKEGGTLWQYLRKKESERIALLSCFCGLETDHFAKGPFIKLRTDGV